MDVTVADSRAAEPVSLPTPRRRWPGIAVAALIAVVLVTAFVLPHIHHRPKPPDARAAGVPVLYRGVLYLVNGRHVQLPDAATSAQLEIVPAGYVYNVFPDDGTGATLELTKPNVGVVDLGRLADSRYRVSPDGSTVVAGEIRGNSDIYAVAINLGTGKRLINTTMSQPDVVDVAGDWALLRDDDSPTDARKAELWNIRTGAVVRLPDPDAREYGLLPTGAVFRGLDVPAPDAPTGPFTACYDVVAHGQNTATPITGFCGPHAIDDAWLSPDGTLMFALADDQALLLRVSDLESGQWAPTAVNADGFSDGVFWDSPTSLVMPYENGYERCTVTGHCQDLHLPVTAIVGQTLGP